MFFILLYMKKLTLAFLLAFFLISCGKEDNAPKEEEIITTPLNISRTIFALNSILQKKQAAFHVALRYWKEESLAGQDQVTLSVNGINAKLIKQTPHEQLSGSNALFEIPPINAIGDIKTIFTVKTSNKVYRTERILRFVDNFNIATVWEKLDKPYIKQHTFFTLIQQDGSFQVAGVGETTPEPSNFGIGIYGNLHTTANTIINPAFIPGLNGNYIAKYDTNNLLKEIEVLIGDENVDQFFDKNAALAEISSVYGTPVINRGKKIYSAGIFDIEVTDDTPKPSAIIKKVRTAQ
jgi:hypothetical protein